MLGFNCTQCGHPAPLSVATPTRFACPSCRFQGELPAPIRAALSHAASALANVDAHLRQIEKSDELAFAHARSLIVGCLVLGVGPWALFEGLAASVAIDRLSSGRGTWVEVLGTLVGFLAVLCTFLLALSVLRRFRARFAANFSATPASVSGGSPCCRVCGAELPAPTLSSRAVSRCVFCRSDSIVAPAVMQRIAMQRANIASGHSKVVAARGRSRSNVSGAVALVLVLIVPFVGMGAHLGWNRHLGPALEATLVHEAPLLNHRYVLVESGFEDCVWRIDEQGRLFDRSKGTWTPARRELLAMSFDLPNVELPWLLDRCGSGAFGTPDRTYGDESARENLVVVKDTQGDVRRIPIECVCGYFPDAVVRVDAH